MLGTKLTENRSVMTIADRIYDKLRRADPEIAREVLDFLEFLESRRVPSPVPQTSPDGWGQTFGALKDCAAFAEDPVVIQRKLRDEWS